MFRFSYSRIAFYLFIGFILIACVQPSSPSDVDISMTLEILPDPPVVGESELAITLTDGDDAPITDATLEVVGDMNHAGMIPVVRDLETAGEDGIYRVPFEWSMGGDWFVTVFAILKDGTEVEEIFDMTVVMTDSTEMDHSNDADEDEMMDMSQTIDTSDLHELDEAARSGTIEPEALTTLQNFVETLNGLELPDEYTADVEASNVALANFEAAMDVEDMDTATTLISEMHDIAHDIRIRLTGTSEESESTEDDGHEHEHN